MTNQTNHINKTAIITGASRGIGAAIAKKLASCGYNLSLCCRNSSDRLKALADELHCAYGIEVLCYTGNVGDFFFAKDMVTNTISHFGHIDVLINNAGISHIGLLSDMTPEEWNNIVAINLTGVFNFTKLVTPYMVADKCAAYYRFHLSGAMSEHPVRWHTQPARAVQMHLPRPSARSLRHRIFR